MPPIEFLRRTGHGCTHQRMGACALWDVISFYAWRGRRPGERRMRRRDFLKVVGGTAAAWPICGQLGVLTDRAVAQGQPGGQLTIAFDTSIAPTFLDPAETPGIATPFVFLYALHDALIKPLPGNDMAPCLVESWTESEDGLAARGYQVPQR
jgi:hypothetical protein